MKSLKELIYESIDNIDDILSKIEVKLKNFGKKVEKEINNKAIEYKVSLMHFEEDYSHYYAKNNGDLYLIVEFKCDSEIDRIELANMVFKTIYKDIKSISKNLYEDVMYRIIISIETLNGSADYRIISENGELELIDIFW